MIMVQLFDVVILLAGESEQRFRSKETYDILKSGRAGVVLVTGGFWGLDDYCLYLTDGKISVENLKNHDAAAKTHYVNEKNLFLDDRSHETIGSLVYPLAKPHVDLDLEKDLTFLKDAREIAIVTNTAHMISAHPLTMKTFPEYATIYPICSPGPTKETRSEKVYNTALFQRLAKIPDHEPELLLKFLLEEHLFYSDGWFDKSVFRRQFELGRLCIKWGGPRILIAGTQEYKLFGK